VRCVYAGLDPSILAPMRGHLPRDRGTLTDLEAALPTRRIFELVVITGVLLFPARATVRLWAKRQLGSQPAGSVLHGIGEVVVTVL
jgi:hypothetical protein